MDTCEEKGTKVEDLETMQGDHYNSGFDSTDDEKMEDKGQAGVSARDIQVDLSPEEEERILDKLREVVRKCTNADPNKRPTAAEVLKLLDAINVNTD